MKASWKLNVESLTDLCNSLICDGVAPEGWRMSALIPLCKVGIGRSARV